MVLPEENNEPDCVRPDKKKEIIRYGSFQDWRQHPNDNRWPSDLAHRGYFYDWHLNEIICFHCGVIYDEHGYDCEIDCCDVTYHSPNSRPRRLAREMAAGIQFRPLPSQQPEQNEYTLSLEPEAEDPSQGQLDITSGPNPDVASPSLSQSDVTSGPNPDVASPSLSQSDVTSVPRPEIAIAQGQQQEMYRKLLTRKDSFCQQGFTNDDITHYLALDGLYADDLSTTIRCFCCDFQTPRSVLDALEKSALDNVLALHASNGSCTYSRAVKEIMSMPGQEPAATEGFLGNNMRGRGTCIICYDHPTETMYLPCKHLYSCDFCAQNKPFAFCLVCRQEIQGQKQIYS